MEAEVSFLSLQHDKRRILYRLMKYQSTVGSQGSILKLQPFYKRIIRKITTVSQLKANLTREVFTLISKAYGAQLMENFQN